MNTHKHRLRLLYLQHRTPFFVGAYAVLLAAFFHTVDAQRFSPSVVSEPTTIQQRVTSRYLKRSNQAVRDIKSAVVVSQSRVVLHPASGTQHPAAVQNSFFPAFDHTVFPVNRVPNWGGMETPAEWNRTYTELGEADFVQVPPYDMRVLTLPMSRLLLERSANITAITAKLFYSTRFFGSYDLDSPEYAAPHAGIDLKLARGTPIHAIAGGRVQSVTTTRELGLHAVIEHRLTSGKRVFSIYGHMDTASVVPGSDVVPGTVIGTVGSTGISSGPHIHLQIDLDKGDGDAVHIPYAIPTLPSHAEIAQSVIHPIAFIEQYQAGE